MSSDSSDSSGSDTEQTQKLVHEQNKKKKSGGFHALGLSPKTVRSVTKKGYKLPTPIQRKTIPLLLDKRDVVAMARTGSGKTAAFLLPAIELLQQHSVVVGVRCLILSPTRELAIQTMKFAKEFTKGRNLRIALILGGDSMSEQFQSLHDNPDILIATPGRLAHVIHEMNLKFSAVEMLICDEADRLFEMGFAEQLRDICSRLPSTRQTTLFSATLPKSVVEFARAGLKEPVLVRLDVDTKLSDGLTNIHLRVCEDNKWSVLLHILDQVIDTKKEQTVVFLPTKHHVEYCVELFNTINIPCTYIYSSLDQTARKINSAKFYTKKVNVLLVTDIAARGIDVPLLDNVINFNFPPKPKLFVHRVGRVARAGKTGTAYSLVSGDEVGFLLDLYLFLGKDLKLATPTNPGEDTDCFGVLPQFHVDTQRERILTLNKLNCLLPAAEKTYQNGYKHYMRSRGHASTESIARAKDLPTLVAHPIFQSAGVLERDNLLDQLKSYRGKTTIFEVNKSEKNDSNVMIRKRQMHDKFKTMNKKAKILEAALQNLGKPLIEAVTEEEAEVSKTFVEVVGPGINGNREEDGYIPYKRPGNQDIQDKGFSIQGFEKESSDVCFDMTGDSVDMIKKQKSQTKWDQKKKKFVRHNLNQSSEKMVRAEDGTKVKASYKTGRYRDWISKTKKTSLNVGDKEDSNSKGGGMRRRGWHYTKNKSEKSDLKSVDTIIKDRKTKAKNIAQHFQKGKSGSKGGAGGKPGFKGRGVGGKPAFKSKGGGSGFKRSGGSKPSFKTKAGRSK